MNMSIMNTKTQNLVCAFVLASCLLPARVCADTITLRMADSLPSGHIIHQVLTKPFLEAIDKNLQGQVKIQHFPGEQLGKAKDQLTLTQTGVIDIGYIAPAYQSDKMPLSAALELPGIFSDYCQSARILWEMTHHGGYLETHEFTPNRVMPIITFMLPPYQMLLASGKNIGSVSDLAGLKIRSAGGAMDFMLTHLNIVPVRMTPPEVYEALSRGTIDGAVFPYQSAASYGITNKLKSGSYKENFGTVVITYSVGENKWKQLPESIRSALLKAGQDVSANACKTFLAAEEEGFNKSRSAGMKTITLSSADKKELGLVFGKTAKDWAASLDKRGKPGSETLNALKKAIAESK